ncbi:endonuclease-reverse transcriptase [Elysia marginata]|uniref:Endonuclease-reverse transcriptase n=1 Tax=Elysia marginata TaxID=1093978 RepID=A0AAV4F5E1_9GAST|nr:endonuclease-reverse transcriptase [Elysia marginata]
MAKQGMVSLNNIRKDRSIPKPLKFKLLKTLVWLRMLYDCETWTMRKADESKIEAAEMWFFRRLLIMSWKDRRTNGNVLAEMGTERTLLSLVKERRPKYIGHAERNTKTDLMKTIFEGKTETKRGRGRPSLSYADQVSKATGLKLQGISQKSQNRVIWRGIVKSSCAAANINPDDAARQSNTHAQCVAVELGGLVYAPTPISSDEFKDSFYSNKDCHLKDTPQSDRLHLLGNFNRSWQ